MSVNIQNLIEANSRRWQIAQRDPDRKPHFDKEARTLLVPANRARFQRVTDLLIQKGFQPVPWWFIGIVSIREYGGPDAGWMRQLGQGDPLGTVSTHDPKGRGPFLDHPGEAVDAWTRAALDALIDCGPHAALWHDWTPGGTMTIWEEYNGLGYAVRGVPSAYVWSGTDQYVSGKFVADHQYRAGVKDVQDGCAAILKSLLALDPTSHFPGESSVILPPLDHPVNSGTLAPSAPAAKPKGLVAEFLDAFRRFGKPV